MPNYDASSGTAGTIRIYDDGTYIHFQIFCSNPATHWTSVGWSGNVGGTGVGGTCGFAAGAGGIEVASYLITTTQYVSFHLNSTGTSGMGGPVDVGATISRPTAPAAPATPTIDNITDTVERVNYVAPSDGGSAITGYEVQYSTSSTFASGNSAIFSNGLALNKTYSSLTPRTRYYHRVRAINAIGTSAWSTIGYGDTLDVPDAPTLALSSRTSTSITDTYTAPVYVGAGIIAQQTVISTDPTFASVLATNTTTTPAFTGLSRNTHYYQRSRAQNSTGWSPWSTTLDVLTDVDVPSTPTGYASHDVASTTAYSTLGTILDNGGAPLTQVNYQINTSASPSGATDVTLDSAREPFFSGLVKNTLYYYRLRVWNGTYWGGWGAWVSFTTSNVVPVPPASLTASAIGDTTVTMSWTAPGTLNGATVTGYIIKIATDKGMTQNVQSMTVGAATLSQVFTGLTANTVYYSQVYATTNNGDSSRTALTTFTTTGTGTTVQLLWENVGGTWKRYVDWENVGGTWKQIHDWENVGGVWKDH